MKQIKIVDAYTITEQLADKDNLTTKGKWVLYQTRKALFPHYDFQMSENARLMDKYHGEYQNKENTIRFQTEEDADGFRKEHDELNNLEVDLGFEKQTLTFTDVPGITVRQIEQLEGIIEFTPD